MTRGQPVAVCRPSCSSTPSVIRRPFLSIMVSMTPFAAISPSSAPSDAAVAVAYSRGNVLSSILDEDERDCLRPFGGWPTCPRPMRPIELSPVRKSIAKSSPSRCRRIRRPAICAKPRARACGRRERRATSSSICRMRMLKSSKLSRKGPGWAPIVSPRTRARPAPRRKCWLSLASRPLRSSAFAASLRRSAPCAISSTLREATSDPRSSCAVFAHWPTARAIRRSTSKCSKRRNFEPKAAGVCSASAKGRRSRPASS